MQNHKPEFNFFFSSDPDCIEQECINSYPGNYDEYDPNGQCFFLTSVRACKAQFMSAYEKLTPLLNDRVVKSVKVSIDALGIGTDARATYLTGYSDDEIGDYKFMVSAGLLRAFLKNHWHSDYVLSPIDRYVWLHEIIHLIDHKNIVSLFFKTSSNVSLFLKKILLVYRHEGIADLFMLMNGHNKIKDFESAFRKLNEDIEKIKNISDASSFNEQVLEKKILYLGNQYSVGSWLVVYFMLNSSDSTMVQIADSAISKLLSGITISDDEIIELLRNALRLSNEDFINSITCKDKNGRLLIDSKTLFELNEKFSSFN